MYFLGHAASVRECVRACVRVLFLVLGALRRLLELLHRPRRSVFCPLEAGGRRSKLGCALLWRSWCRMSRSFERGKHAPSGQEVCVFYYHGGTIQY